MIMATTHQSTSEELRSSPITRRVSFPIVFAVWTLFGLWSAQQTALLSLTSGAGVESWPRLLIVAFASAWFWALLTPALMWNTRRLRERFRSPLAGFAAHALTFLIVHLIDVVFYAFLREAAGSPTRPFRELLFSVASYNVLTYGVIVVVTMALDYRSALQDRLVRTAQVEAQLAIAQFHALSAQLHPHFLFNSLNAISALISKDSERAEDMLARLSELLRSAIDTAGTPEVRLVDEVEFVRRYLEIEQMRYGDRLSVRIDLNDDTLDSLVPGMLLQPIVENAVRHGVAPHPMPGGVHITAERLDSMLRIVVRDTGNGVGANGGNTAANGVGLRTTRARLEKLYGPAHELVLAKAPGGWFEARVTLPFRREVETER